MADKIIFPKKLNDSVQTGDELYYTDISTGTPNPTTPISLGTIIAKGEKWVKVDPVAGTLGQVSSDLITNGGFDFGYGTNNVPCVNSLGQCVTFDVSLSGWDVMELGNLLAVGPNDHFYHATSDPFSTGQNSVGNPLDGSNRLYIDDANWFTVTGHLRHTILGLEINKLYRISFDYEVEVGSTLMVKYHEVGQQSYSFDGSGTFSRTWTNVMPYGVHPITGATTGPYILFFGVSGGDFGYIDNVKIEEVLPANDWYVTGSGWDIIGAGKAIKISGTADWLNQDLDTSLVEGEEYTLTMDIVGGSPATGDIKIANTTTGGADVDVVVDAGVGTATWIQGSTNLNKIRIWQNATGDAEIDNVTLHMTSFDFSAALGGVPPDELYFMFQKPEHNNYTNVSSLKGYFAETEFSNSSSEKQELFAVGSEVTISSK